MSKQHHGKPEGTIIPPKDGWKPHTYYVVEVKYFKANPVHTKVFYSGFINKDNTPGSYNQMFEGNDNGATYNSSIQDTYYCRAKHEIPFKIDNP